MSAAAGKGAQRAVNHLATRTFFQKWIRDAPAGWPIMILAPLPAFFALYIGGHHFANDNTVTWNKSNKLRFWNEEMYHSNVTNRSDVRNKINERVAAYGGLPVES